MSKKLRIAAIALGFAMLVPVTAGITDVNVYAASAQGRVFSSAGWNNDNGTWYYANSQGQAKTGWEYISGKWYYMYKDSDNYGVMAANTEVNINGNDYRFNPSGTMKTG